MQRFVAALNARDCEAAGAFMADDFTYIDCWRDAIRGRDAGMAGLTSFFERNPAVNLKIDELGFQSPHVLMRGTLVDSDSARVRRAVWRVLCKNGKLQEWQSWAEGGAQAESPSSKPERVNDL